MRAQLCENEGWAAAARASGRWAEARACGGWAALAGACSGALAWLGLTGFAWNDYDNEARASVEALVHGHLVEFFRLAPAYGGSLLERAPFALAPDLWGGGELAVYRMLALPCLFAAAALGVWLAMAMRQRSLGRGACALALLVCVANPLTLLALEIGHPDELLGGVLCVAAVLLAARGRIVWAALALGLAIPNKQWAVLAVAPVLIALPVRRLLTTTLAAVVAAAFTLPFLIVDAGAYTAAVHGAASAPGLFQPWQLWWFLGHHTSALHAAAPGVIRNYRTPPDWVINVSHPLIVALVLPLGLAAWVRMRRTNGVPTSAQRQASALLLLALLLLLRCMLDPWDNIYYPIPFVLAVAAWEAVSLWRAPVLAFAATIAVYAGHHWLGSISTPDVQAIFFAAWSVPLVLALGWTLYRRSPRTAEKRAGLADDRQLLGQARQDLAAVGG